MLNVSYTHYNRDTHPIFVSDTFKKGKNILQLAMPAFYLCVLRTPSLSPTATLLCTGAVEPSAQMCIHFLTFK